MRKENDNNAIERDEQMSRLEQKPNMADIKALNLSVEAEKIISEMMEPLSSDDIAIDLEDIKTILSHKDILFIGKGEGDGSEALSKALINALQSQGLDITSLDGALGVLLCFTAHPDYPMKEPIQLISDIHDRASDDADVIVGFKFDKSMSVDTVRIVVVVTGVG